MHQHPWSPVTLSPRPSIDVLFESAVKVYRAGLIGVILSSVKQDGTQCLKPIKECGGLAIVQNPATSFIDSMHIRHGRGCC